jgi:hypothetical protein
MQASLAQDLRQDAHLGLGRHAEKEAEAVNFGVEL